MGGLDQPGGKDAPSNPRDRTSLQGLGARTSKRAVTGITPKRTKRKLRQKTKEGTPGTKVAAEEVLHDLATGVKCSATDTIDDAASDSECEFENSQQVADMAVDLKKLERKRKE